jgi:transcriptional regulator with XRE-family HTH domain
MTIGQKLTFYRKKKSLTQQQLGEMLNISAQAVSKWENDLAEPDIPTLKKLAELYGISLDRLVSEEDVGEELPPEVNAEEIAAKVEESYELAIISASVKE